MNPKNANNMNAIPSNSMMFDASLQVVRSKIPFQIPTKPKARAIAITRSAEGSLTSLSTENKPMVMGTARINTCLPSSCCLSVSIIRWKGWFSFARFSCVDVWVEVENDGELMVVVNSTLAVSTEEAEGPVEVLDIMIEFSWISWQHLVWSESFACVDWSGLDSRSWSGSSCCVLGFKERTGKCEARKSKHLSMFPTRNEPQTSANAIEKWERGR